MAIHSLRFHDFLTTLLTRDVGHNCGNIFWVYAYIDYMGYYMGYGYAKRAAEYSTALQTYNMIMRKISE
ncbi:MAG: hypothetical protein IIV50_00885 [Muribaculaceae bacterium]|nr:hypothetical protein [Muribaculaceae bacterium]